MPVNAPQKQYLVVTYVRHEGEDLAEPDVAAHGTVAKPAGAAPGNEGDATKVVLSKEQNHQCHGFVLTTQKIPGA